MNYFVITQFIAYQKDLPQMFDAPMMWCINNIEKLSKYFNEENQL